MTQVCAMNNTFPFLELTANSIFGLSRTEEEGRSMFVSSQRGCRADLLDQNETTLSQSWFVETEKAEWTFDFGYLEKEGIYVLSINPEAVLVILLK